MTNTHPVFGEPNSRPWTPADVREYLPDVKVRFSGVLPLSNGTKQTINVPQVIDCITCGRLNEFATVRVHGYALSWQFSWDAIARSLNTGKPLQA